MPATPRLRFEVLRRDGFRCRYCGKVAAETELQVDHVVPEALGGSDEPANLVTCCAPCNIGKSSIAPDSPLVEQVAADAARWAAAMQWAAKEGIEHLEEMERQCEVFDEAWGAWRTPQAELVSRASDWPGSIEMWMAAGLTIDHLVKLIPIAMRAPVADTWRYYCGVVWNTLRDLNQRARDRLAAGDWRIP
uniref:Putative homing endonuclease n=1 Tax=viral metagenome TaxID=1070528 RepID=A0A6M3J3E8_9ZZZZ